MLPVYAKDVTGPWGLGALFGAFTSVLVGGIGAIIVALLWLRLFPELARVDKIGTGRD
jgi:hypothetical protein